MECSHGKKKLIEDIINAPHSQKACGYCFSIVVITETTFGRSALSIFCKNICYQVVWGK